MKGNNSDKSKGDAKEQLEARDEGLARLGRRLGELQQGAQNFAQNAAAQSQQSSIGRKIDAAADKIYDKAEEMLTSGVKAATGFFKGKSRKETAESLQTLNEHARAGYRAAKEADAQKNLHARITVEIMRFKHFIDPALPQGTPVDIQNQYQSLLGMRLFLQENESVHQRLIQDLDETLAQYPGNTILQSDAAAGEPSAPTPPPAFNPYRDEGGAPAIPVGEEGGAAAVPQANTLTIETIRDLMSSLEKREPHISSSGVSFSSNTAENMKKFLKKYQGHRGALTQEQLNALASVYVLHTYSKSNESHKPRAKAPKNSMQGILFTIEEVDRRLDGRLGQAFDMIKYNKARVNGISRKHGFTESQRIYDLKTEGAALAQRYNMFFPEIKPYPNQVLESEISEDSASIDPDVDVRRMMERENQETKERASFFNSEESKRLSEAAKKVEELKNEVKSWGPPGKK